MEAIGRQVDVEFSKNPLLCPICHDYFTEPCILSCYHTFCGRCLRGREHEKRLICPLCGQPTMLKEGSALPAPDALMRQLIEIANSENPPCSNCDKRDRSNMYYCNTCGQSLCTHCRDNTHRAKMFASHEVLHMSKCAKEPKRCPAHGEQYIMYSPLQNTMLCVNCFRDAPNEIRSQCQDIETAYSQASKRLEKGQNSIMDLQSSVRDGIIALKGLMDELRRNMDSEKHTINSFCQGMQEAIAKTHAAMIMEVQRQFESKERIYRSQLLVLGTVMPVLQLHLILCATFTSAANKYQFLELCPSLLERLSSVGQLSQPVRSLQSSSIKTNYRSEFAQCLEPWVGKAAVSQHVAELAATQVYDGASAPPPTKRQQTALKGKLLDTSESSFAVHCRSFESQIRELGQQFTQVKERVSELHKDIAAVRRAQTPPLSSRYEVLNRDCALLDQQLERQQQQLDRMTAIFDASWEEQLWRLRIEQEVFSCQRADVMTLRNELKHLKTVCSQLEPHIRNLASFAPSVQASTEKLSEQAQQLQSLLENIGLLQQSTGQLNKLPRSRSRVLSQFLDKVRATPPERERSKSAGQTDKPLATPIAGVAKPKKDVFQSQNLGAAQTNLDRFETQLREKIHDIICRRQSAHTPQSLHSKSDTETDKRTPTHSKEDIKGSKSRLDSLIKGGPKQRTVMYKKMGKSCDRINTCPKVSVEVRKARSESEYQHIGEASRHSVKATIHKETRSSPSSPKCKNKARVPPKPRKTKVYPYSDGEDNVFYPRHNSADSQSTGSINSRRSSFDEGGGPSGLAPDKTLIVFVNRRTKNMTPAQKQRSWETFPPKRRQHVCHKLSAPAPMPLRKADSFEGHEEAVKSIVAAVQETRRKSKGGN